MKRAGWAEAWVSEQGVSGVDRMHGIGTSHRSVSNTCQDQSFGVREKRVIWICAFRDNLKSVGCRWCEDDECFLLKRDGQFSFAFVMSAMLPST